MNKKSRLKVTSMTVELLVKCMERGFFALALAFVFLPTAFAQQTPSAAARLGELGPENSQMAQRAGIWDVVETVWDSSDAKPTVIKLMAERRMIGSFLQEILQPAPNSPASDIKRIDYLSFNRLEGRWKYISMDTRAPVGMMPAASYGPGDKGTITLTFDPFAVPVPGNKVTGQLLRMEQLIIQQDADRDRKDQYFVMADGTGKKWLAHRYEYVRRGGTAEVTMPPPGASKRLDAIKKRGSLRVAVLDEYPWLKQNKSGAGRPFEGPAWRLAEEYAKRLGVRLETTTVNFDNKVSVLKSDQVDITIAPLLATPEREKIVDLIVYSVSAQCLFGRADNPKVARANSIDDLNRSDVTITYINGSPQGGWLQKRLPKSAPRGVGGNLADVPVDEILWRRADVTTIDKYFFAGLAKKTPGLVSIPKGDACLASEELPIPIAMAVDKNQPAFLAWLRTVAEAIKPQLAAEQVEVEKAGS